MDEFTEQTVVDRETGEIIPVQRDGVVTPDIIISRLAHILHAIGETTDVGRLVKIREAAEAVRFLTERAGLELEVQNQAAAARIETERKLGDVLLTMDKSRGLAGQLAGRDSSGGYIVKPPEDATPTYADMGIDKAQAHRWQTMAQLPYDEFELFLLEQIESEEELTSAAVYRKGREWVKQHDPDADSGNVHYSSASSEWYTPAALIRRVVAVLGSIDLDPCSNDHGEQANVPAGEHFTRQDNGLIRHWNGRIYMNPPYGRTIGQWVDKLNLEYQEGRSTEAIALLPSRTDTIWFEALRDYPRCFIHRRVKFEGPDSGGNMAPFPSMVVYLGRNVETFYEHFRDIGDLYVCVDEATMQQALTILAEMRDGLGATSWRT